MGKITDINSKKLISNTKTVLLVRREFVGSKSSNDALIPIIVDDLINKTEKRRTFDNDTDSE